MTLTTLWYSPGISAVLLKGWASDRQLRPGYARIVSGFLEKRCYPAARFARPLQILCTGLKCCNGALVAAHTCAVGVMWGRVGSI